MTKLQKRGRIYFDDIDNYAIFDSTKRMSKAHVYMIWKCVKWLEKSKAFKNHGGKTASIYAIKDISIDKNYPDITTELLDIECETGLKHSYEDLKDRISRNPKMLIIVTPNQEIKARYLKNCQIRKQKLRFCTMKEFPSTIHDAINSTATKLPVTATKHDL
jgi:hypothetical protein